jgi:hypothetical protein
MPKMRPDEFNAILPMECDCSSLRDPPQLSLDGAIVADESNGVAYLLFRRVGPSQQHSRSVVPCFGIVFWRAANEASNETSIGAFDAL